MKKRLFIFGVCLCVAGRLIAQDVHFMKQHEEAVMKSSVYASKGMPLKLKTNLLYDALYVPNLSRTRTRKEYVHRTGLLVYLV